MDCLINQLIGREIDRLVENCFRCLNENSSNIKNQIDSLLVYSELIWVDYKYAERFYHPINKILCGLRESKNLIDDYRGGGMIGGLGEVAFSVDAIQKQTGELKKLSHSLNQLLISVWDARLDYLIKMPLSFGVYDVISGLAGVLYFYLDLQNRVKEGCVREKIEKQLIYLISLAEEYQYNKGEIVKFHIKNEQQYLESERRDMPNGHLNFGMAHGMIGPYIVLAKAKFLGYKIPGLELALNNLEYLYDNFSIVENGILKYPRRLSYENYVKNTVGDLTLNCGWCYGNISIVRGLMKVNKYINNKGKYEYYKDNLLKIISQNYERYNLNSPIVCHGYSSVILIQIAAYKETGDKKFISNLEGNVYKLFELHKEKIYTNKAYYSDYALLEGVGGVLVTFLEILTLKGNISKLLLMD